MLIWKNIYYLINYFIIINKMSTHNNTLDGAWMVMHILPVVGKSSRKMSFTLLLLFSLTGVLTKGPLSRVIQNEY